MIVPAMNWHEIEKEYYLDLDNVLEKGSYYFEEKLRRRVIKERLENYIHLFNYCSINHNQYLVFIMIKNKKVLPKILPVCVYNNEQGLNAIYPANVNNYMKRKVLIRFTAHCMKRYRTRINLNITEPLKIVEVICRDLIFRNVVIKRIVPSEKNEMYLPVEGGGFLGYFNLKADLIDIRTFISDELIRADQIQTKLNLRKIKLEDYPTEDWNKWVR